MATIVDKINALNTAYGSKEKLVEVLDIIQKQIAFKITK
jgi:hypothetical protein